MDRARILAKLEELRQLDPQRELFAASSHGYALADPVDPALLANLGVTELRMGLYDDAAEFED